MILKITMDNDVVIRTEFEGNLDNLEKYFLESSKCGHFIRRIGVVLVNIHKVKMIVEEGKSE